MPIQTRTFRIFVSSTFEDLKEERDALQRDVFPKLRTLCELHGARFQAIDLRWGVRDEAALDQQTVEICLSEIRRCQSTGVRPNFIALLGDRYGWQPLPARIRAAEFDALLPHIPAGAARTSFENAAMMISHRTATGRRRPLASSPGSRLPATWETSGAGAC